MSRDEAAVGRACDRLMRAASFVVENYEQQRPTGIFEGLPDRRYVHTPREIRLWVELKAPGKQMTRDQHEWILAELAGGGVAVVIDDEAQMKHVLALFAGPRVGRLDAVVRYCRSLVDLCAQRGYRGETKQASATPRRFGRKRTRRAAG